MKKLSIIVAALFIASPAVAQWQTPNHSVPVGKGAGTGFDSALGADNQALMGVTGGSPTFRALTGADIPSTTNVQTTNYTIQTSDCGNTVQIGTGSTGFGTFTLPSAAGFPSGCRVTVKNGDTTRGKGLSGFPTGFTQGQGILWPQQTGTVQNVSSAWTTVQRPGRAKLASGTFNVFTDFTNGTDTFGLTDGMASGTSAFKTLQKALYTACDEFDFSANSQTLYTVNMAANTTDTMGAHYACPAVPGGQGGAQITVTGGSNATISTTNTDAIAIDVNATVAFIGITLQSSGTVSGSTRPADCFRADFGGQIFALNNIFSVCAGSDYAAENGGKIYVMSHDFVNGGSQTHFFASTGGVISTDYPAGTLTTTIGASISKTVAWAKAVQGGVINVPTWAFSLGAFTVTGTKVVTGSGGVINTGVSPLACQTTYFPGTVNGTSSCTLDGVATAWTPTITTDGTAGTPTYTVQVGSYEVIGRQVTARFWVAASAWAGSPTGNVQIGGLPLTSANTANDAGVCVVSNWTAVLPASNFGIQAFVSPNATKATLQAQGNTASTGLVAANNAPAVSLQFIGMCNYHT